MESRLDVLNCMVMILLERVRPTTYLNTILPVYIHAGAPSAVENLQERASDIERYLKAIGQANQNARKELAVAHASLSQSHSQQEVAERSQSLRGQLLSLAAKQKQLLQCFVQQKEISSKLSKLLKKHRERKANQPFENHSGNKFTQVGTSTGSIPTNVSAALPNLAKHLKTPAATLASENIMDPFTVVSTIDQAQQMHTYQRPLNSCQQHDRGVTKTHTKALDQYQQLQGSSMIVPRQQWLRQENRMAQSSAQSGEQKQHLKRDTAPNTGTIDPLRSSDLAQPVPLDTLVKHNFMQPRTDCISCKLIVSRLYRMLCETHCCDLSTVCVAQGCEFKASLLEDGSLKGANGDKFQQPQQWVSSCWATLGHQKKIKKTHAYKMVRP